MPSVRFVRAWSQSLKPRKEWNGDVLPQISGVVSMKFPLLPTMSQYRANRRSRCIVEKSISLFWRIS